MLIPMKESWQYYTYLRRWRWLLLLGATSDFMVGLVYSNLQVYPVAFDAKATLAIEDLEGFNLTVPVIVQASSAKDAEEAIDSVALSISLLNSNTDLPIIIRELAVTRYMDRSGWWKGAVFGAVIGMLLTIGMVYIWEDVLSYNRDRLNEPQREIYANGQPVTSFATLPIDTPAADVRNHFYPGSRTVKPNRERWSSSTEPHPRSSKSSGVGATLFRVPTRFFARKTLICLGDLGTGLSQRRLRGRLGSPLPAAA